MTNQRQEEITRYLEQIGKGDESVVDELLPHIYEDLRILARKVFRDQRADHTLQPTALMHEAYMRLVNAPDQTYEGRKHFFRVAALAMRQLLIDYARTRGRAKRVSSEKREELDEQLEEPRAQGVDVLALSEALNELRELDPRQADVVELRFLVGLTGKETADVLGVSERTVGLDWTMARAWLERWMSK